MLNWVVWNRTICIKMNLALNSLQRLICHKTQTANQSSIWGCSWCIPGPKEEDRRIPVFSKSLGWYLSWFTDSTFCSTNTPFVPASFLKYNIENKIVKWRRKNAPKGISFSLLVTYFLAPKKKKKESEQSIHNTYFVGNAQVGHACVLGFWCQAASQWWTSLDAHKHFTLSCERTRLRYYNVRKIYIQILSRMELSVKHSRNICNSKVRSASNEMMNIL